MRTDPLVLDLTEARAALLVHRDGAWMRAGEARFGAADFRDQAAALVARARALAPAGAARPAMLALLPEDELITDGIAADLPPGAAPDPGLRRRALGPAGDGDGADLAITARAEGGWLTVHALPREVVRQTETFLNSIGLDLAAILVPLADGATPAWFPVGDHAGVPMPAALGGFDRRRILAHPPADLAERLAADARSRAAARLDPAHLQPLEDAPAAPPRRRRWRWPTLISPGRGMMRPVALTAALCAGLAAAAVWLPPLLQRPGTAPATDLATAGVPAAPDPASPSRLTRPEASDGEVPQAPGSGATAPDPEARAEAPKVDLPGPDLPAPEQDLAPPEPETASPAAAPSPASGIAVADYFTPMPLLATPPARSPLPGDALTQPSLDPVVGLDPTLLARDIQPPALPPSPGLAPPPPPEQRFSVDARGLVVPSPAGRVTPEGHMVFAGQPPALPRSRPEDLVAARLAEAEATPPPVLDRATLAEDDPLKRLSPRQRPDGLRERTERAQLGGRTEQELAGLRPAPRPEAVLTQVTAFVAATPAAAPGVPRPDERPEDLPAEPRQVAAPRSGADAARAASTAALSDTGGRAVQPNRSGGGTTAAVAAAATQRGFNLSQVSLLGTFGPGGKLRALVRLPNGDVLNVSVGDRMDGGRVQAINGGRLVYVKGGRSVTLTMPSG